MAPSTPSPAKLKTPTTPPSPPRKRAPVAPTSLRRDIPFGLVTKADIPWIGPHLGHPCTANALDHQLTCGHKVLTHHPEPCASNCRICHSPHANPRSLDEGFTCFVCIVAAQKAKHEDRVKTFKEELEAVAKATNKYDPENWIEFKLGLMEKAWTDVQGEETMAAAERGRFACPVYYNPDGGAALRQIVDARAKMKSSKG